jgi:Ca-activated chloride channel homolog
MMQTGKQWLGSIGFEFALIVLSFSYAPAQRTIDEAHVALNVAPVHAGGFRSRSDETAGVIRQSVELVLVPVTVMDQANRIVTGLQQQNFHLLEDKHPQPIKNFWKEDEPVSVGVVLDVSGSMRDKLERAQDAVKALLEHSNPDDEFFLLTFADQPSLVQDFTQNVSDIQQWLPLVRSKGETSLLDAIVLAANNMKKARYRRKALLIISDGGDNRSRYTEKDIKSLIREADILVYSIGVFDREFRTLEERLGPELLGNVSSLSGASAYVLENPNDLPRITSHIALELRNQYILGYSPQEPKRDGKWRKIKIRLRLPRGAPELHVQARTGYYSASQ